MGANNRERQTPEYQTPGDKEPFDTLDAKFTIRAIFTGLSEDELAGLKRDGWVLTTKRYDQ